jgi:hypothetical protein
VSDFLGRYVNDFDRVVTQCGHENSLPVRIGGEVIDPACHV